MCVPGPFLCHRNPATTIGRSLMLDFEHRTLAGLVRRIELLGDDPIEAGALEAVEPLSRERAVARRRGQVNRWSGIRQHGFQPDAPLALWCLAQILVAEREQIPGDERRGRFSREHLHARCRWVNPEQKRLEIE